MKEYSTGIFIGKFYPLHFGHISAIQTLREACEKSFVLFFYNPELDASLAEELGYEYPIDQRIKDCKSLYTKTDIQILKLEVMDSRPFPQNRDSILKEVKVTVPSGFEVQLIGGNESNFLIPHIYAKNFLLSSQYIIETENGTLESLHSSLIRKNFEYYSKYLPSVVLRRLTPKIKASLKKRA